MYCFKCGVSGDKVKLFDAISEKGVVKICKECSSEEDVVFIKKKQEDSHLSDRFEKRLVFQPEKSKTKQTVYERLSRMSGVDLREKEFGEKKDLLKKQETSLKEIVDKNFNVNLSKTQQETSGLVDNFHWIIMRARRLKHLTQEQLAEAIAEPEAAIKIVEQGVLKDYKLINKLENYLGVKLLERTTEPSIVEEKEKMVLGFDPVTTQNLTISDLQEMKKKKESGILGIDKGEISETEEDEEIMDIEDTD